MSQASLIPTVTPSFPPLAYQGIPVLTTEMLAQAYTVEAISIRKNFSCNRERFIEGKHFFSVSGQELKAFRLCVTDSNSQISPKVRSLTLWTERGAARHAKMLNSDRAWDVFELLEETFFRVVRPESDPALPADSLPDPVTTLTPSTTASRKALEKLVKVWASQSGIPHAPCWTMVNSAFNLQSITELPEEWVPDAIAWVQEKIDALPRTLPPAAPATPPSAPAAPAVAQPVLSAELDRCMAEFEVLARSVEDMERLMVRVRRLASPITSAAARAMAGSGTTDRTSLEGLLEEYLDRSRRLAMELVPCARLGINVMRDLAQAQGR